jgi:tRNA (guanine-N7-)-methyltransferase
MSLPTPFKTPEEIFVLPVDILQPLNWDDLFPIKRPIEVEIGAGDGSFILKYAGLNRERNFLAVERLLGRIRKIARKSSREGLDNMRVLRLEASYVLKYLLPPGSVDALHIYFPDPWPKRKHRKNRLVNEEFPAIAAKTLRPKGMVHLRTDDADYFAQMKRVFATSSFKEVETPEILADGTTDFERGFMKIGIKTLRASYSAPT